MRKIFRNKTFVQKILWGVAVIIILSFGFFGSANYFSGTGGPRKAGKAFGRTISMDEFEKHYAATFDQAKIVYGDNFAKVRAFLNIEAEAWDRLILVKEAQKRKLSVTDDEIVRYIQDLTFFKPDGQFDKILYKDILRYYLQRNARDFEENIRTQLMIEKLFNEETAQLTISPEEILNEFKKRNEKIKVSYILFDSSNFASQVTISPEEIQQYYAAHKEELMIPASTNIEYIIVNFANNASDDEKKIVGRKAIDIYSDLVAEPNIQAIAQKNNLTVQSTGLINMEEPPVNLGWPFEAMQTIFSLDSKSVVEPFMTNTGYVIAQVKEKRNSYIPELTEVSKKVSDLVQKEKSKTMAKQKANEFLPRLQQAWQNASDKNFKRVSEELGMNVFQTPFFKQEDYLPNIGLSKDFNDAALALNPENPISTVVETAKGFCIIHFDSKEAFDDKAFNEQRETFTQTLLNEKRNQIITSFLSRLRTQANIQDYLPKNKQSVN